ncbi:MAG TPA: hypothetical protein VGJ20_44965 [Xanthobacteraceae bacterium]|jgi:hypothetical protein
MKLITKLSPLQRAYLLGYKRGARRERALLQAEVDAKIEQLETTNDLVRIRAAASRYLAIERALATERDPDELWLN